MSEEDKEQTQAADGKEPGKDNDDPNDLNDLLQELRILLQGAQVLTAFLTVLPFNAGFEKLSDMEKGIFIVTFLCSLTSLICLTAPAAMHRLMRPVEDRVRFKNIATRLIIIGLIPASIALALSAQLVTSAVVGEPISWIASGLVAALIGGLWWLYPLLNKNEV